MPEVLCVSILCKQTVGVGKFPLGVVSKDSLPSINEISSEGFVRWPLEPEKILMQTLSDDPLS